MKMRGFLNKMVRFYLMRFPITEGKKQLWIISHLVGESLDDFE